MSLYSDSFINTYKKATDIRALPFIADKEFYMNFDPQHQCLFEIIMIPSGYMSILSKPLSLASLTTILDPLITRWYLYDISLPIVGFEFERYNGFQEIINIEYPSEVTATYLVDDKGIVRGYFRKWMDDIVTYDPMTRDYSFNDNQEMSKKDAIIIPLSKDVIPSIEYIKIEGLKYKSMDAIPFSHEVGDIQKVNVNFSADNVRLVSALSAFF